MSHYAQETPQKSGTYKFIHLNEWTYIIKKMPIKASGIDAELVFIGDDEHNVIHHVYVIPNNFRGPNYPPHIVGVIYHDIGEEKEFCGFKTEHVNLDPETGVNSRITTELKVNDDVANEVLDLIYDRLTYKNTSDIKLYRTTTEAIMKPQIVRLGTQAEINKKYYGEEYMKMREKSLGFSFADYGLPNIDIEIENFDVFDFENTDIISEDVNAKLCIDIKNLKARLNLKGKAYEFDLYHVFESRNKNTSDITFCISKQASDIETITLSYDEEEYLVSIKSKVRNIDYYFLRGKKSLSQFKNFVDRYKSIAKANNLFDANADKVVKLYP